MVDEHEKPVVERDDWEDAVDAHRGFCPECAEFTTEEVAPDAFGRQCALCGGGRVVGARHGRAQGFLEVAP